ncbi:MAG: hypothetical protein MZV65_17275 [Chromatiales bacterium]|nr:hypothetical protein [Chromatiales bacterium]
MDKSFAKWRPHPRHGLSPGPIPPSRRPCVFVEITPFDLVKYEVDKATGYPKVDRAQRIVLAAALHLRLHPADLLGRVRGGTHAQLPPAATWTPSTSACSASAPSDAPRCSCVPGWWAELPMLDGTEADEQDPGRPAGGPHLWRAHRRERGPLGAGGPAHSTISPPTSSRAPETTGSRWAEPYGRAHAEAVVSAAIADYREEFGPPEDGP